MAQNGIQPGNTVCAQYWARDPGIPAPNNISLTDAAMWVVVP
jgi:hypothetical protein